MSRIEHSEWCGNVLVVGDVVLDRYWLGDVTRISPEAPVPIVAVNKVESRLGGAANIANNVSSLAASATLLAILGDDEVAREIESLTVQAGISPQFVVEPGNRSKVNLRVLGRAQQLLQIHAGAVPVSHSRVLRLMHFRSLLPNASVVVISEFPEDPTNTAQLIAEARTAGKKVVVDPKGSNYSSYTGATVITPNRSELEKVIGHWKSEADLTLRTQHLREELRCDAILLTRAEAGMTLFAHDDVWHVAATPREVFDLSGAGDTLVATLAVMLAEGKSLKESVALANAAAGVVIGKIGAATVTRAELFQRN